MQTHAIAPHKFARGYHRQVWWNWLIGSAFFFGEIGAGLFLVSLITEHTLGMLVGYLIVMAGKNTAHLLYLGKPQRFWRAAMRPDRSWIARGIWATGVLGVSGAAILAPALFGESWRLPHLLDGYLGIAAGAAALFIMFYDGLVMNSSAAIPFWHTGLLPVLCLTYAALGGTTLSLTLRELTGAERIEALVHLEHILLAVNAALLGLYLYRMSRWTEAARHTVYMLVSGTYARFFLGLVLAVGLAATLVLSVAHAAVHAVWLSVLIAVCELIGDFTLLMVLLKSGLFASQDVSRRSPAYKDALHAELFLAPVFRK